MFLEIMSGLILVSFVKIGPQSGKVLRTGTGNVPDIRSSVPWVQALGEVHLAKVDLLVDSSLTAQISYNGGGQDCFSSIYRKGGGMFDRHRRHRLVRALALTLLVVAGFAGAATAAEAAIRDWSKLPGTKTQKAVRSLLSQKADVNARSSDGSTALLWLAHWNDVDTADLLLECGCGRERRKRLPNDAAIASLHQRKFRHLCACS